jgi:ADP-ribose pyrophosphatase YjhB (NUDIX family)
MYPTDLTVAAVIEQDNKFLLVEEYATARRVLTQPGGHIEADESPEQAVVREVLEESGCTIECEDMIGVYLWIHPQTRQQFLRLVFAARFVSLDERAQLDDGILARRWMSLGDIRARRAELRTPAVLKCVEDYLAGRREADGLLTGMLPLQQNVHRILASADLV